jgi:hypothetical protein
MFLGHKQQQPYILIPYLSTAAAATICNGAGKE